MKRNRKKERKDYFLLISINYEFDKLNGLDFLEPQITLITLIVNKLQIFQ